MARVGLVLIFLSFGAYCKIFSRNISPLEHDSRIRNPVKMLKYNGQMTGTGHFLSYEQRSAEPKAKKEQDIIIKDV